MRTRFHHQHVKQQRKYNIHMYETYIRLFHRSFFKHPSLYYVCYVFITLSFAISQFKYFFFFLFHFLGKSSWFYQFNCNGTKKNKLYFLCWDPTYIFVHMWSFLRFIFLLSLWILHCRNNWGWGNVESSLWQIVNNILVENKESNQVQHNLCLLRVAFYSSNSTILISLTKHRLSKKFTVCYIKNFV